MDVAAFLTDIRAAPGYAEQIVHVREQEPRAARFREPARPLPEAVRAWLATRGIEQLYSHQAEAIDLFHAGRDVLVVTGTASGKSLCYQLPILEMLLADPADRALLLFPMKALAQDQFRGLSEAMKGVGLRSVLSGVYDGDTPAVTRRKLRDRASVVLTNPDMLHAGMLPQHAALGRLPVPAEGAGDRRAARLQRHLRLERGESLHALLPPLPALRLEAADRRLLRHHRRPEGAGAGADRPRHGPRR